MSPFCLKTMMQQLVLQYLRAFYNDITRAFNRDLFTIDGDVAILFHHNGGLATLDAEFIGDVDHAFLASFDREIIASGE